ADRELVEEAVIEQYLTTAADGKTATSVAYDRAATATQRFLAAVQNKLHFAVHGQTGAEVIVDRADAEQPNMGLTTWEGAPQGKSHRYDVVIAKNYLSETEMDQMQRIVSAYLDMAEIRCCGPRAITGDATHPDDDGRLGGTSPRLPAFVGSRDLAGRRQGERGAGEAARAQRVREVPHRARPALRERLRPRARRDQAAQRGHDDGRA